ncbi:DUF488 domain-containing protein [Tsuneonella sp. CC-YZS046]|uniref:DUF488 domain-containing protein n=1 Tax=Tsuneonella sp. CC-YZS046 TaxID=3042152 RepID=UPI002D76D2A4|nr:DUF488 domain-containing protein [Tsuneonella sp. CC-YZS046]WRO67112.1 DUF488 domain-containing protein [Tsuneonella sp. CC-YZS046]
MKGRVAIKRIYEPPSRDDGCRVLVDRLWPRGVGRDAAALDLWLRDIAPSPELRKWFGHDPARFKAFRDRYRKELEEKDEAVAELRGLIRKGKVTLLYAARDELHNHARVLADYIERQE